MTDRADARGVFITLEGGEGAGKSTQARLMQSWLAGERCEVVLTREPGGSPHAECLREMLLGGRVAPFGNDAEALVFAIARADHVAETIRPALERGAWVICDRFIDSTRAYQGSAGVPADRIDELEAIAVGQTMPDLTLILDLPAEEGLARANGRDVMPDRFEADDLAVHQERRDVFLQIAQDEPDRCAVVDASRPEAEVFERIRSTVRARLGDRMPAR
ncbi:MAG TPA: dTMP kinase [Afifellaceae bacterium]|nr:dTMP kinase [Afifellaceae bacterium]